MAERVAAARRLRASLATVAGVLLAGCSGAQSALAPAGPQAARINDLWWGFFAVCAAVYAVVVAFLAGALLRRRGAAAPEAPEAHPPAERERRLGRAVAAAVGLTVVVLAGLLAASVATGKALTRLAGSEPVAVAVVGRQWWWEVRYPDPAPSRTVTTANEIHLPVGRPARIELASRDVIHSFWVPSLHGKRDLIPGYDRSILLQADRPGVYRGQCAEFCGAQHAHMALVVVAEPPERFAAWLERQRRTSRPPATPLERRGQTVFLSTTCFLCHTVQGTPAGGRQGPDLTHFASRRTIAAATLPNDPGALAGWIADPQHAKPGNRMPLHRFGSEDLRALVAYLGSLD